MPLWQRLIVTVLAMLVVSFIAGLLWRIVLGIALPDYIAGMVGGLITIPVWEFSRKIEIKKSR